jgi:transposase
MPTRMKTKLSKAATELEAARERRDALIVEASVDGMSRREVAAAVGLTAGRIQHIVNGSRDGKHPESKSKS